MHSLSRVDYPAMHTLASTFSSLHTMQLTCNNHITNAIGIQHVEHVTTPV